LVANKTDLKQRRVVSMKQGKELAESHGLEYFETSAVSIRLSNIIYTCLISSILTL
jgi:hypothetical protein